MASVPRQRSHPLHAVIKYRNFRLLWSAGILMQVSQWVQNITLGWLALNLTNNAAFVGRVTFMSGLPILLLSIPAGMVLDRADRRRVLLTCQIIGAIVAVSFALYLRTSTIAPWHLLLAAVLNGTLLAVSVPTTQTLVPTLVERKDLTNALGLSAAGSSATRILGPSLGGALIGAFGSVGCFVAQAVVLVIASMLSFFVRTKEVVVSFQQAIPQDVTVRSVRRNPVIMGLLLQAVATGLLAYPMMSLIPVLARDQLNLGPTGLGLLVSASGAGAVIGSFAVASLGEYQHKGRLLAGVGLCYGVVMTAFAQSAWVPLSAGLFACSSCLGTFHNALTAAMIQEQAPERLRGQVTSMLTMSFGMGPIGALAIGELAVRIGISNAISCGALAASLCIGLTFLRFRQLLHI